MIIYVLQFKDNKDYYFNTESGYYEKGIIRATLFEDLNSAIDASIKHNVISNSIVLALKVEEA